MPVTQTIKDFYQVAQARDFTRNFQFRVTSITDRGTEVLTTDDLLYITTAELPAREIANKTVPFMGLTFNVPGAATYPGSGGYAVVFRSDMEQVIRRLMENWQRSIFDDRTSTGAYRLFANSRLTMDLLDQNYNTMRQYVLHGVWPQSVGNIGYDLQGDGDIVTLTVNLCYQYWTRGITG